MANDPLSHLEAVYDKFNRGIKASGNKVKSPAQEAYELFGVDSDLLEELKEAVVSALKKMPKNTDLLELAARIYFDIDDGILLISVLDKWKKADKKSIIPYLYHAEYYYRDEYITYDKRLGIIKEALKRQPDSPEVLSVAYDVAHDNGDNARRLICAEKLASKTMLPAWFYIAGVEQKRNKLYEKAENSFRQGLKRDPNHLDCMIGLATSHLKRLNLDSAEHYFRESLQIQETKFAKQQIKVIDRLRDKKAWSPMEIKQMALWQEWADKRLKEITEEEQKQRIAALFAKGFK